MHPTWSRRRFHRSLGQVLTAGACAALKPVPGPVALLGLATIPATPARAAGTLLPLFDAHIHYSHDAVSLVPPAEAVAILRQAGLRGALVSSSDDQGTQLLVAEAPDLIVPSLRPYRSRGDISTWMKDEATLRYLEQRLDKYRYAAVGEFHLYGDDADLPVPRRMVQLARQHGLLLHAHSDIACLDKLMGAMARGAHPVGAFGLRPARGGAPGAAPPPAAVV